jgi:hypothetical protein
MGDEEPFIGLTVLVVEDNYLVAYILVAAECIVKGWQANLVRARE